MNIPAYELRAIARVREIRAEAIQHRDAMLAAQKAASAAGDREGAKFFKTEAADALKQYRAACLVLAQLTSDHPGDCVYHEPRHWPRELSSAVAFVSASASIA